MSKEKKETTVPKLRFPEFRDAGEWSVEPLGNLYSFKSTNSLSRAELNYEKGSVKNIHYGDIHTKYSTLFDVRKEVVPYINSSQSLEKVKPESYCSEGDIIFADASEDEDGVGKSIEVVHTNNEKLLSGLHTILARQKKLKLIVGFAGYLFKSRGIRVQIQREAQGAKVLGISVGRLSNIRIYYPEKEEQQKIANCLSSMDELISAQSQKLEALKDHKKGLMQQLFPAEGETVPKLRFPEFRDAGEWEIKSFGELCRFIRGPFGGALKKDIFVKDGYAVYEQSHAIHKNFDSFRYHITEEKFNELKRFSVLPDDIIMSCSGTMGKFAIVPKESKKGIINQALLKLTVKKVHDLGFIKATLELSNNQNKLLSQSAGGAIKNVVSVGQIKEIDLYIPSLKEQQKIADCLSSVDELITAQSQKLEVLKAHKKGLMQQLFPSPK